MSVFDSVRYYPTSEHYAEYIVRIPQILSSQQDLRSADDSVEEQHAAAEILAPLSNYLQEYIKPDIVSYLSNNGSVSDSLHWE